MKILEICIYKNRFQSAWLGLTVVGQVRMEQLFHQDYSIYNIPFGKNRVIRFAELPGFTIKEYLELFNLKIFLKFLCAWSWLGCDMFDKLDLFYLGHFLVVST